MTQTQESVAAGDGVIVPPDGCSHQSWRHVLHQRLTSFCCRSNSVKLHKVKQLFNVLVLVVLRFELPVTSYQLSPLVSTWIQITSDRGDHGGVPVFWFSIQLFDFIQLL